MRIIYALFLLIPSISWSQAQVFPTHVTLTEEAPSSYLNLRNTNSTDQTYKIELVYYSMSKDGSLKLDPKHDSKLFEYLKFSPKTISLKAAEKQVVRVMMTSFDELPLGEHHLHIRFVPDSEKTDAKENKEKNSSNMSLQARIAVAVPVVVRKGEGKLAPSINGLKATTSQNGDLSVSMKLKNDGPYYLYGDIELFAVTDKGEFALDKIIGLGSYISERDFAKSYSNSDLNEKTNGSAVKKVKMTFKSNTESAASFDLSSETDVTKGSTIPKKKKTSKRL